MDIMVNDIEKQVAEISVEVERVSNMRISFNAKTDRIISLNEKAFVLIYENSLFSEMPNGRKLFDSVLDVLSRSFDAWRTEMWRETDAMPTIVQTYHVFCEMAERCLSVGKCVK